MGICVPWRLIEHFRFCLSADSQIEWPFKKMTGIRKKRIIKEQVLAFFVPQITGLLVQAEQDVLKLLS